MGESITPAEAGNLSGDGDAVEVVNRGKGSVIFLLLFKWGQSGVSIS